MKQIKENIVWIVIIFLLSAIFRLSSLDLIEFKSDEAITVYQSVQFFNRPHLIERGLISGLGVYNFPLFNYLIIVLSVWSRDPQFLSGAIALINTFLVVAFFLLVNKYYNKLTAIFASLLLAFSPWGVIFSRKIWAQDLINLFLIPYLYFLHEIVMRRSTKFILPLFILLALLVQLHGSGVFLLTITILILVVSRAGVNIKNAVLGLLIGFIPAIPYILFQINSSPPCPDCEAFVKYQQSFRAFDFYNLIRPFQVLSGLGHHFVLGKSYSDFIRAYPVVGLLNYIFATVFPVVLMGIFFIMFKKRNFILLIIYFITIPLLYLITKTSAYMHYFVIIIPVSILLLSISLSTAYFYVRSKFLKTSIVVYFLLFLVANITFMTVFSRFLSSQKRIEGDYGPIYSVTKSFIERETSDYRHLPYYDQLLGFAYIYAQSENFHSKLGEFFLEKGDEELATREFKR